jgi:hypothetical protein
MGFNGGGNVLPIELSQFLVQLRSNDAILSWTTLSERNSEKFEIERSLDGIIFEKIAEQQAAGNSNFEINYQAIDYNVANNNSKIIYYRLKQTDFDGSFIYSPIKTIILKNLVNSFNIHGVYPNPFTNNINIKFEDKETDEIRYELFDSKGGLIVHQRVIPEKGINTTTISLLNELSKGMYLLKITDGNVSYTTILQKQ